MHDIFQRHRIQFAGLVVLALTAMGAATPAAAASACDTTQIQVEFLGVGASNTILVLGNDGYYTGNVMVQVYCGIDGSLVTGSVVAMWTTVPGTSIYDPGSGIWLDATNSSSPVQISVPTGQQQITLRSTSPDLSGWKARVGTDTVTVIQAFGQTVTGTGGYPTATSAIWAETPELDSLALFGTGAVGLLGYTLLRRKASRSR